MKQKFPYIIFEVTSQCNLNCMYCYNIWKRPNESNPNFNSYKDALKTLKKIFKLIDCDLISFTGGEPLLAERLLELVLYSRVKNKLVNIITNGNTPNYPYYKELNQLGINYYTIPLHSFNPKTHDLMTRKIDSHSNVLETINILKSINANISIDIVLSKVNIGEIKDTVCFIKDLGIEKIMITRFNIGGEGIRNAQQLIPDLIDLKDAFTTLNSLIKEIGVNITSNVCTPLCVLNPNDYDNIFTISCAADIYQMPVTFDINGNVRICNHSPVFIGNIFENKFDNLLNSNYISSWKTTIPDYCKNCSVFDKCFGGCRAASEQLNLGLGHPDPILMHYNNILKE